MTNPHSPSLPEIRHVLSATPSALRSLVTSTPAAALEFHDAPGAWSPFQVLCHITDGEVTDWIPRLELILSPGPPKCFTPFDREAGFRVYAGWSADKLLREFERLRGANLDRLAAIDLRESDFQRIGIHPELGTVTLAQLVACWVTHDLAHISQVSRSLVRYFGSQIGPWRRYFSLLSTGPDV